jgi:ectoine hydroxylase-related dioxygenase (phytanoyl-CoA dioxygenase family)
MKSKKLSEFILNKKLARLAAELMNVKGVRLYQDKPFFKGPNENNSPPHQDRYGSLIRSEHHKMIAAWMPLSFNISTSSGALLYLPASHRKRKLFGKGFSFNPCPYTLNEPDSIWKDEVKIKNMTLLALAAGMEDAHKWIKFKGFQGSCGATFISPFISGLQPGDIAFHDGFLIHASSRNTQQNKVRAAISVQYFEDGAFRDVELDIPTNNFTNDGASQILWGNETEKGDKVTSKYTPLLYHISKPHLIGVANYLKATEQLVEVDIEAI